MIIRNCPAIKETTLLLTSEPPQLKREYRCCTTGSNLKKCENINDCVMKRIVEKCRTVINDDVCLNCNKFERGLDCYECDYDGHREDICMNRSYVTLAKKILDLLDIQEVE